MIRKHNLTFGHVFTSILKRSYDTASIVLEELNQKDVPSTKTWRYLLPLFIYKTTPPTYTHYLILIYLTSS